MEIVRAIQKESKDAKPIQELCEEILSNVSFSSPPETSGNAPEHNKNLLFQLRKALELFSLSSKNWSSKRHPLAFDFVRTTLRNINESSNCESLKNETISKIISVFSTFSEHPAQQSQIVIDICSVLVEIATNFSQFLTIQQTIEIIEICHSQIRLHIVHGQNGDSSEESSAKKVFLHHLQALQSKLRPSSFGTKTNFQDPNLEFENFILSDDN